MIHGKVDPAFEPVREAFAANLTKGGDIGAACCVHLDGRIVVDLWGGVADPETGRPWEADTPVLTFSATKGVTAICVLRLVERGLVDLDAPVATYWPEYAQAGKAAITVAQVLSHRAGVPVIDAPVTLDDVVGWHGVVAAAAAQAPVWEPGTTHGYHLRSYGWLLGELVRRVTGRTIGTYLADELAGPLGIDLWLGLPEAIEPRLARLVPPPPPDAETKALVDVFATGDSLLARAFNGPGGLFDYDDRWNTRPFHAAEMPSSNSVATARALSRLYAATAGTVEGVEVLTPATLRAAAEIRSDGTDEVLGLPTRFGLGFALAPFLSASAAETAVGHPGAGGSLGFADPARGLGFAYVMNHLRFDGDSRADRLVRAVYDCC